MTSIAVTVQHSACLMFAGSFKPAYSLSVHALPSQVQTVTNKRNLILIQQHLEAALRVPASRGVVRFVGVPEECMGIGGKTVAGVLAEVHERAGRGMSSPTTESLEARVQRRKTMRVCQGIPIRLEAILTTVTLAGILKTQARDNIDSQWHWYPSYRSCWAKA